MKLSAKIQYLRKKEGLSQEELADKIDVSRQTVYKWESNAATPEIEKIKIIAKLFNVSFDYLMDDDIEDIDIEEKKASQPTKYRYTFDSKIKMKYFQADIDHGYSESRKRKLGDSETIYGRRTRQMDATLKEIGAEKKILLQGDLAGCFFENPTDMFFGFYYGGNIQFICPFENFINVQLSDSGQEMTYERQLMPSIDFSSRGIESVGMASIPRPKLNKASSYTIHISYFDQAGSIADYKLDINCKRLYTIYESKNPEDAQIMEAIQSDFAHTKLNEIYTRLNSYPVVARKIFSGERDVKDLDEFAIQTLIKGSAQNERNYEREIENRAIEENHSSNRVKLIVVGVIVTIVVIILIVNGISKAVENDRIDKENKRIATEVVEMINEIGEVSLNDKQLLSRIEQSYSSLNDDQKKYVTNYDIYTSAEATYDKLYRSYMDEQTKDDPTRSIVLSDLNGVWECSQYRITIGDIGGGKSVWYHTYNKKTGSSGLGGVIFGNNMPSSSLGSYDSITQTKSGRMYEWASGIFSEYHDFTIKKDSSGKLTLQMMGYTFTKNG